MTAAGWLEIALFLAILTAITPLLGALHGARLRGERDPRPRRAQAATGCSASRGQGQDWKAYARSALVFTVASSALLYLILRTQGCTRSTPPASRSTTWDVAFNTAASFVTNTNWQFYGGETTLSYFTPDGRARGAELRLGGRRHRGRHRRSSAASPPAPAAALGNFWVDLTRALLYVLLPLSVLAAARSSSRRAWCRRSAGGARRRSRSAPSPRRRRSSCSARTAAASSTSTPRTRSRTRRWLTNFVELLLILAIPAGADRDLRPHGRQPPPGLDGLRARWRRCCSSPWSSSPSPRAGPTPAMHAGGDRRRQPRGQGAALRRRLDALLDGGHDRRLVRRRQRARWSRSAASAAPSRWRR